MEALFAILLMCCLFAFLGAALKVIVEWGGGILLFFGIIAVGGWVLLNLIVPG